MANKITVDMVCRMQMTKSMKIQDLLIGNEFYRNG